MVLVCTAFYLMARYQVLPKKHMIKHKKRMGVMAAINKSTPLFDGFVKIIVGLIAFINLFGIFWYPSIKYTVIDIIFVFGLCFRLSFVISNELPKWKIFTVLFFYLMVLVDQVFDAVLAGGSLDKILSSSSVVLMLALISVFFLDLLQFKKTQSAE